MLNINKTTLAFTLLLTLAGCGNAEDPAPTVTPNSPAQVSGNSTPELVAGTSEVSGQLSVTDADANEAAFQVQTAQTLDMGQFSITADGQWSFTLDSLSSAYKMLPGAQNQQLDIAVRTLDGTQHIIQLTIWGMNDSAEFSAGEGVDRASINRDSQSMVNGTLAVSDVDIGEGSIVEQSNTATAYAHFSIDTMGQWQYMLDTNNSSVVDLAAPNQLTDTVDVFSDDGSMTTITLTIEVNSQVTGLTKGNIGNNDSVPEVACTTIVNSTSALEDAASFNMTPGATLCLALGNYTGLDLTFGGQGSQDMPITIAAQTPGQVVIGGEVFVGMTGSYVTLQGFVFKDGSLDSSLLQTRANSNTPCNHCRVTENAFIDMDEGMTDSTKWLLVYGSDNRIDHNWFSGKTTRGALLVVERGDVPGTEDRTLIDHNYFGDRPPANGNAYADSSDNEYEAIRVGSSKTHTSNSFAVIEHNYFERIDAEAEVISNKAGGTTIHHNTVRNSRGSIVTRHGEGATISNNFILGDDNPFSAGIRIIDANHTVTNNYIEGVRYESSNFNGGILIHASDGSTTNGYQQVENILVANNTVVDSVNSLNVFAGRHPTEANNVYFVNNIVANAIGPVVKNVARLPGSSTYAGNYIFGQALSDDDNISSLDGMNFIDPMLSKDSAGLFRPSATSPVLSAELAPAIGNYSLPATDMDGQTRSTATLAGADDVSTQVLTPNVMRGILSPDLVGPLSYTPPATVGRIVKVDIANHDFDSGDLAGWINNGAAVTTNVADVFSRKISVMIPDEQSDISQQVILTANTNYTLSAFIKGRGKLSVEVGDSAVEAENTSSDYKFAAVSFNSGDNTTAMIKASKGSGAGHATGTPVPVLNPNFDNGQDDWMVSEGTGIGQVQDSSNSSTNVDGSIKFKYNSVDNGMPYNPYISQTIAVTPNTDYRLKMHFLVKNDGTASVIFGAHPGDAVKDVMYPQSLNSKEAIYSNLVEDNDAQDKFREDTVQFNSGDNTTIAIFAQYKGMGDENRVDEFSLVPLAEPDVSEPVFFDSFRLVSHPSIN